MAIGFALRALARRRPRPTAAPPAGSGMLDFSTSQAGALSLLITEDF